MAYRVYVMILISESEREKQRVSMLASKVKGSTWTDGMILLLLLLLLLLLQ
jgi:hypothetical protein